MFVLFLFVLMGAAAVVVDLGYWYLTKRIGQKFKRIYVASGEAADRAAAEAQARKQQRQQERDALRQEQDALDAVSELLSQLAQLTDLLADTYLLAAGFYQHKRTWRKRRHGHAEKAQGPQADLPGDDQAGAGPGQRR